MSPRRSHRRSPRRLPRRSRSRGQDESRVSTRRLEGEVAQLKRQEAVEASHTPWSKVGHQRQYEVLQKIWGVCVTDLNTILESVFGSSADIPINISTIAPQVRS